MIFKQTFICLSFKRKVNKKYFVVLKLQYNYNKYNESLLIIWYKFAFILVDYLCS